MDDDRVFKALADPTRRLLLDQLFERDGRTLTELESHLAMTRFGVMKHLRVLEEAGLVVSRKDGRTRRHYLNVVPIRLIHDRWIDKYTERRAAALTDLKAQLENQAKEHDAMATTTSTTSTSGPSQVSAQPTQIYQVFIKTTPEAIWEALIKPEFTVKYFHGGHIETTENRRVATGPDGALWGDDAVVEYDPPRRLVHEWRSLYDPECAEEPASRVTWEIEPRDGGLCLLTVTHDRLDDSPKTAASVRGPGWMFVLSSLKTLLETGRPINTP